jgi:hypothetical protein
MSSVKKHFWFFFIIVEAFVLWNEIETTLGIVIQFFIKMIP